MSEEPSEIALLYGQASYSVVDLDQYPVNDKVALQLAGLQLQVSIGDPGLGNILFPPFYVHSFNKFDCYCFFFKSLVVRPRR